MKLRFDGARGQPHSLRYLVDLQVAPVPQQHDRPLLGVETSYQPIYLDTARAASKGSCP